MNTSTKLSRNIPELVRKHIALFDSFDHVYLFGSALNNDIFYNDIDLLIIYAEYSDKINNDLKLISEELEKASGAPIDLTVLSVEEEKETAFLEKINFHCLKLK